MGVWEGGGVAYLETVRHKLLYRTIRTDNPAYFSICVMRARIYTQLG